MRITTPLNSSLFKRHPIRHGAAGGDFKVLGRQLARHVVVLDLDHVIHLEGERRHIDLAAIDLDMAVADHLARGGAGIREAEVENNVVETGLENLEHLFARDTTAAQSAFS